MCVYYGHGWDSLNLVRVYLLLELGNNFHCVYLLVKLNQRMQMKVMGSTKFENEE